MLKDFFYDTVVLGIINVSLFYINYIILIPQLIGKRRRYLIYILAFIALLAVVPLLKTTLTVLMHNEISIM